MRADGWPNLPLYVFGGLSSIVIRLSSRIHPGRYSAGLCCRRSNIWPIRPRLPLGSSGTTVWHHQQCHTRSGTALYPDGHFAGKVQSSRRAARKHGKAIWRTARRPGDLGGGSGDATGRKHWNRGRDGSHHGAIITANHVAKRLQPLPGCGNNMRHWHPGTDYSTLNSTGTTGRYHFQCLSTRPVEHEYLYPENCIGWRFIRRCRHSRLTTGCTLHRLPVDLCDDKTRGGAGNTY